MNSIIRRALEQLEIELILALSPQAKGRIERLFGTLQDRLIKEMRVTAVSSLAEANRFLHETFIPFWNRRFTVRPADAAEAHRPLPADVDLNALFAETESRVLREDFTFRHHNQYWQVEAADSQHLRPKQKVIIEHRLDDSLHYRCGTRYLKPVPYIAPALEPARERVGAPPQARRRPPADHPWRKPMPIGKVLHGPRPS